MCIPDSVHLSNASFFQTTHYHGIALTLGQLGTINGSSCPASQRLVSMEAEVADEQRDPRPAPGSQASVIPLDTAFESQQETSETEVQDNNLVSNARYESAVFGTETPVNGLRVLQVVNVTMSYSPRRKKNRSTSSLMRHLRKLKLSGAHPISPNGVNPSQSNLAT
jgi:hypothetical protein